MRRTKESGNSTIIKPPSRPEPPKTQDNRNRSRHDTIKQERRRKPHISDNQTTHPILQFTSSKK
jgi:hypothetical protein